MAMTDEEWADYQRKGLHMRPDQRTAQHLAEESGVQATGQVDLNASPQFSSDRLSEISKSVDSIRRMLKFFVVLAVIGLILGLLNVVIDAASRH
jgi:hypothetical protein